MQRPYPQITDCVFNLSNRDRRSRSSSADVSQGNYRDADRTALPKGVPRRDETGFAIPRYRDFRERARFFDALFLRFRDWPDSDIAIAIACLRLFTLRPLLLRRAPRLCSPMTFETLRFCRLVAMNSLRHRGVGQADAAPDHSCQLNEEECAQVPVSGRAHRQLCHDRSGRPSSYSARNFPRHSLGCVDRKCRRIYHGPMARFARRWQC